MKQFLTKECKDDLNIADQHNYYSVLKKYINVSRDTQAIFIKFSAHSHKYSQETRNIINVIGVSHGITNILYNNKTLRDFIFCQKE